MNSFKRFFVISTTLLILVASVGCSKEKNDSVEATNSVEGKESSETTKTIDTINPNNTPYTDNSSDDLKGLLDKSKTIDNYSWECVFDTEGVSSGYKYWVKGKKIRLELGNAEEAVCIYTDGDKNVSYMYNVNEKSAIELPNDSKESNALRPDEFMQNVTKGELNGYKKKGTENVEGMECTLYEYTVMDETIRIYIWDKYEVMVKMEVMIKNKVSSSFMLKNYKVGTITEDMVSLPKGTEITSFSKE